jgi:diguanylate cyclase (GGDEF)-like protein/PAS domain S-box-containing protein
MTRRQHDEDGSVRNENLPVKSSGFPLRLFTLAYLVSVLALLVGTALSWQLNERLGDAQERRAIVQQYIAEARLLDETLTMSARMGAATGDATYEQGYDEHDVELNALLRKTKTAIRQPEVRQFVEQTDEASRKLAAMTRQAFALSAAGRNADASALLLSDEYLGWKKVYADGVERVAAWDRARVASEERALELLFIGFAIANAATIVVLMGTWYFSFRAGRRWNQERLESDAVLRQARDELENRVERGTAEFEHANETLQSTVRALAREVEERKRGEAALAESRQVIDSIVNAVPARIFWKDRNLVYLGCNASFAHDAGFASPAELLGKDDYQMGWRDQAELYRADDRQVIETGQSKLLIEEPQTTPDGKNITLLTNKVPLRKPDGEVIGILGTYMDITERKRLEEIVRESDQKRDALLHAVARGATAIMTAANLDEGIHEAMGLVSTAIRIDRTGVLERPAVPGSPPAYRYAWNAPDVEIKIDERFFDRPRIWTPQLEVWQSPLKDGKIIMADSLTATGDVKKMLDFIGAKSILLVPIFVDGKYWGMAGFDSCRQERIWPDFEREILRMLADQIGSAIQRDRYLKELADANRIVQNTPTILYRMRGEPSLPMVYVSQNIRLFGHDPAALTASPLLYRSLIHPDDRVAVAESMERATAGESGVIEFRLMTSGGEYRWVENHFMPVLDKTGRLVEVEGLLSDVTERKAAADKIAVLARTDSLTGLANRTTFIERLRQLFAAGRRGAPTFALLYLDIDRFKDVNDTLGHPVGDHLLVTIGERMQKCIRETDLGARLGGDEFAVLQTDLGDTADAGTLAVKLRGAVAEPIQIAANELHITASIGIAIYGPDTVAPEDMLAHADVALYRAKEEGRDQYRFHTEALDTSVRDQVAISSELRQALECGELELYYQPQVELSTNQIIGMEALIRWNHPKRGLLLPAQFIEIAERTGMMTAIGQWVLESACRQMSSWRAAGVAPSTICVNVSPVQIKSANEFVEFVSSTLDKWHLAPADLELDVTESTLARATLAQNDVLERLQRLGVKISIDDFGMKFSSLDYLKTYHVSRIKIPQPLLKSAPGDHDSAAMARAIVDIARELNIEVIAEGVETEAQWSFLTTTSPVPKVQGYYYSKPVAADAATALLRRRRVEPGC